MTSDSGDDQKAPDGWEEKAANVLNAVMVMAIGLAVAALGVWLLWRFAAAVSTGVFGPDMDWIELLSAALFVGAGIQILRFGARTLRFGARMRRSKRK